MRYVSKTGLALAGAFALMSAYLIFTQGLFGESFIALQLGMPWVMLFSYFEFFNPTSVPALATLLILPIIFNAVVLYIIGIFLEWAYDTWMSPRPPA